MPAGNGAFGPTLGTHGEQMSTQVVCHNLLTTVSHITSNRRDHNRTDPRGWRTVPIVECQNVLQQNV